MLSIIPWKEVPIFKSEEQFWQCFVDNQDMIEEDDILVVAHTPWSRILGPIYELERIIPSEKAKDLSNQLDKDPRHIEIILRESTSIVKYGRKVLVTENKAGVVCANAGIDQSNAGLGKLLAVPHNPDEVAKQIKKFIFDTTGKKIAVIISDTVGRALRRGAVNIGIGCAGIGAMRSEVGKKDLFGYVLRVSEVAIIDELASAAELVQGQTDEGTPFVTIRGYSFERSENASAKELNRPEEERIFR